MFKITNGTKTDFLQRYDGVEYMFPAGKPVYCPEEAAKHIFGIGNHDKDAILLRNGWAKIGGNKQDGIAILNAFKFEPVAPNYDAPFAQVDPEPALGMGGAGAKGAADDARKASASIS